MVELDRDVSASVRSGMQVVFTAAGGTVVEIGENRDASPERLPARSAVAVEYDQEEGELFASRVRVSPGAPTP